MKLEDLAGEVAGSMEESIKQACPTCKRGAANLALPAVEDLEALIDIRDGFNKHRRNFSPEMAERFRRFDSTIAYLHAMLAGAQDAN
jgi:hypothetical protein